MGSPTWLLLYFHVITKTFYSLRLQKLYFYKQTINKNVIQLFLLLCLIKMNIFSLTFRTLNKT